MRYIITAIMLGTIYTVLGFAGCRAWDQEQHNYDKQMLEWAREACDAGSPDGCELENHFYDNGLYPAP